jgi:transcriptional regulator with XRE-family HTH domain
MYTNKETISKRIINIMVELGINQNQLAKMLNITQPAVSKYLQGRIPPPFILLHLAELSGKSIEWILTGEVKSISQQGMVSEKPGQYQAGLTLEEKINILPIEIRKNIESLIDSLLNMK